MYPKKMTMVEVFLMKDDLRKVLEDLQDPAAALPMITGVRETESFLWLGNLETQVVGRIDKTQVGCCRASLVSNE